MKIIVFNDVLYSFVHCINEEYDSLLFCIKPDVYYCVFTLYYLGDVVPMEVYVFSTDADVEAAAYPAKAQDPTGFKLNYSQTDC